MLSFRAIVTMTRPNMFANLIPLLILSLLSLSSVLAEPSEVNRAPRKLKVGVIAPLTGGVANWGNSVLNAMQLANSESTQPADIIYQDEETCLPGKAVSAFQYLIQKEKVDLVIASCLGGARAIAPLAKKSGIPLIISGRSAMEMQNSNPNALSWLALLDHEGEAISKLIKAQGWKKGLGLVWNEYFGIQFAEAIKKSKPRDFEFRTIESDSNATSLMAEALLVMREKPDVIFLMHSEPNIKFLMSELKKLGYQGSVILQSSILQTADPAVRKDFAGALQQKFEMNDSEFRRLKDQLSDSNRKEVADDFVFSYDGFKILLEKANICLSKSDNLEACLESNLRDEQWHQGVSGSFRFMKGGYTERPMVIKRVTVEGYDPLS
jgi:branched-chain amino acid transport system substrate-binding protein